MEGQEPKPDLSAQFDGPWRAREREDGQWTVVCTVKVNGPGFRPTTTVPQERGVCSFDFMHTRAMQEAMARRIALAPDLHGALAALCAKDAVDHREQVWARARAVLHEWEKAAKAAREALA